MCAYWLYILKHELHAEGCTLAMSVSPTERDLDSGKLQTATYKSWDHLSPVLAEAGISPETLQSTKAALDSDGWETLRDISLRANKCTNLVLVWNHDDPVAMENVLRGT